MIVLVIPHDDFTIRCGTAAMGRGVRLMCGVLEEPVWGFGMNQKQFCDFWDVPRANPVTFAVFVLNDSGVWKPAPLADLTKLCASIQEEPAVAAASC